MNGHEVFNWTKGGLIQLSHGHGQFGTIHHEVNATFLANLYADCMDASSVRGWYCGRDYFNFNALRKFASSQAAVHALLQAAIEVSSRGDRSDGDTNIFVQRSSHQCIPLENAIQQELSAKQPAAYEWFWLYQHTVVVVTFVNLFEKDPCFALATSLYWKGDSSLETTADITLLMPALCCLASIKMLGLAKLSCTQFFSSIPDVIGRSMDKLLDFVPLQTVYYSLKDIILHREFVHQFGPRAASVNIYNNNDQGTEEI